MCVLWSVQCTIAIDWLAISELVQSTWIHSELNKRGQWWWALSSMAVDQSLHPSIHSSSSAQTHQIHTIPLTAFAHSNRIMVIQYHAHNVNQVDHWPILGQLNTACIRWASTRVPSIHCEHTNRVLRDDSCDHRLSLGSVWNRCGHRAYLLALNSSPIHANK